MAYVQDRLVHDADSHLMELEDCLDPYFDRKMLAAYHALPSYQHKVGDRRWSQTARRKQDDPAFRAGEDENILLRKTMRLWARSGPPTGPRPWICWASPASWCSPPSA